MVCHLVCTEVSYQGETVYFRHDEVLQDDRGADLVGRLDGQQRALAVMKIDVPLRGEHSTNGFPDDRLIVDQEDGNPVLCQGDLRGGGTWMGKAG